MAPAGLQQRFEFFSVHPVSQKERLSRHTVGAIRAPLFVTVAAGMIDIHRIGKIRD
jgi:hypothetical protein